MIPGIPFITGADHPLNGWADSTLAPNPTEPVPIQTEQMQMPADRPYLIDEIRAIVRVVAENVRNDVGGGALTAFTSPRAIGAVVELDLSIGPWRLTDGFVPLWMLSIPPNASGATPALDNPVSFTYGRSPDDESIAGGIQFFPGSYPAPWDTQSGLMYAHLTWRFAEPLIVPGNMMLTGALRMNPAYGPIIVTDGSNTEPLRPHCWLGFQGRMLPFDFKTPSKIKVPWADHWAAAPAGFAVGGAFFGNVQPSISGDALKNPFLYPLHIQRLLGRLATTFPSAAANARARNTVVDTTPYRFSDGGGRIIKVDSENAGRVISMIPRERIHRVFGRFPYWNVGQDLDPGDKITITVDPMRPSGAAPADTVCGFTPAGRLPTQTACSTTPLFGINGWRLEDVT